MNAIKLLEKEKEHLKNKLKEYEINNVKESTKSESNTSVNRMITESPIPLRKSLLLNTTLIDESKPKYKSPSLVRIRI